MAMAKSSVFVRFSKATEELKDLKSSFEDLCLTRLGAFVTLTINQCNAAYARYGKMGKSFSQADVDADENDKPGDKLFCFGTLFEKGFNLLESYLEHPESAPADRRMEVVLSKLLEYLLDKSHHNALKSIKDEKFYECELAVRYAEHLFSRLGVSELYTIDKYYTNRIRKCSCGCKKFVDSSYGDTSIGNTKVWHGNLDIVLDGCFLPVEILEELPESPGGKSSVEVKSSDNLGCPDVESQLVAQTIVFSFLQKKKHPEYSNYLIPCIGISNSSIIFHMYDCKNDVLLKSAVLPVLTRDKTVNTVVILAVWFMLNYKYLCSGFNEDHIKNHVKKSRFFEMADCLLPIYQNEVTIGGNIRTSKEDASLFEPWHLRECDLVLPPSKKLKTNPS